MPGPNTFQPLMAPPNPAPLPSIARGPPCKPKRSGHAVWVGNLSPRVTIVHMKDYFSTEATEDLESVFLISKSNCAFVNYKTADACAQAIRRFDGSNFCGNRIVCRVRRQPDSDAGSLSPPTSPTSAGDSDVPSLSSGSSPSSDLGSTPDTPVKDPLIVDGGAEGRKPAPAAEPVDLPSKVDVALENEIDSARKVVKDKFFILKSLTLEDLQVSTRDQAWMTQPHNEEVLNRAFHTAENVYLIFSANKSGGYFGYARMTSPIRQKSGIVSESPAKPSAVPDEKAGNQPGRLHSIPTPATATAPKGHIIDDSARGTIFWEAESEAHRSEGGRSPDGARNEETTEERGAQFGVAWMSTTYLPFHVTRGLRNPYNSNREVKIARDGTEVHPWVGARLVHLFHGPGSF